MSAMPPRLFLAVAAFVVATLVASSVVATTITVIDRDGAGEGLNDPSPRAPLGGNPGTTLGAQRLNALQFAADIWESRLASPVEIRVGATFDTTQSCAGFAAVLGAAGAASLFFNFSGAAPNVLYPGALADKVAGMDLDPGFDDIVARFNSNLGAGGSCNLDFYLGFDGNPPSATSIDLVAVALHELGHGLGFAAAFNASTGAEAAGLDDVFELGLERHGVGPLAPMTNAGRAAAAIDDGNLHFTGPLVTGALGALSAGVSGGHVQMYAPTTLRPGSSVSHFDVDVFPNELMEPSYTGPNHEPGLALPLLCDIWWGPCGTCGDGIVDPSETCDDGGTASGDGCSATCGVEACFACSGEPSTCTTQPDDTPCTDGTACTQADSCQGGVCVGGVPVVCVPLDDCHDAGVCNPLDGLCSNPARADGSACDDGDDCTTPDQCTSGVCSGMPACIDAFLCHRAKTSKLGDPFLVPPADNYVDELETATLTAAKPRGLCAPATVDGSVVVDAATHLESYAPRVSHGPKHAKRRVLIQNQLGTIALETVKRAFVLLQANASLVANPPPPDVPNVAVDQYDCYAAKVAPGTPRFAKNLVMTITDPLLAGAQTFAVRKPTHVCVPVTANGNIVKHPAVYQVCYQVKPTVKNASRRGVFVHPEFRSERLDVSREERVCLPSLRTLL
jgi:cysteine-rich repeat protein